MQILPSQIKLSRSYQIRKEEYIMGFTVAQQNAIDAKGRTLLVSAAAGSGKTFTLTQRIIKSIIENDQDISRLLIVTFTRAAAAELRAKISAALSKAIAENPGNAHLQRQLIKLGNAHISTIDSFFSEPIRANFEKLSLPASIRLSDEAELSPIRDEAMMNTLNEFFEHDGGHTLNVGESTNYYELLGIISAARNSSSLVPTLTDIYKKLITSTEGILQLKRQAERMRASALLPFFDTEEGKLIHAHLTSLMSYVCSSFETCCRMLDDVPKYFDCFTENKEMCEALSRRLKERNYGEIKKAFEEFSPGKLPTVPKDAQPPDADMYKNMRSKKLNPAVKNATAAYLSMTEEEIRNCFIRNAELCELLCDILFDFEARYTSEKLRRGVCEFSDMPKLMLKLLLNPDGTPTEYCLSLRESFDEVYIDEYQDVNEIQDRIFELIGANKRFMVGDIKQSIYGFREAEPSIFANYRRKFTPYGNNEADGSSYGNTIFMSNNFRCDENVITFTNTVCSQIFSAFAQSIGYTKEDDLIFSKAGQPDGYKSPAVMINLIEPGVSNDVADNEISETFEQADPGVKESEVNTAKSLSDEAIVVANEIARLIGSKDEKRADGKKITAGDIAVLVRGHSYSKPLTAALDMLNIKYTTSSKSAIFDDKELKLIIDLLSVIDNPRDDVPLSRLLTATTEKISAVMSLDDLISIRKGCDGSRSLYDALLDFEGDEDLTQGCRDFTELCDKLRRIASKVSADKLLRAVVQYERFAPLASTEAFSYIYDHACKYTRNVWNGLGSFLPYFKSLAEKGEGGGAEPGKKDEDAVTIMTIHQSKGLEFCVCMLFGLGKRFNLADSKAPLIFSKELGVSMKLPPRAGDLAPLERIKIRYKDNPLVKAADLCLKQKQLEEEARIFYVALTRARERLYLSATLKKSFTETLDELSALPDPVYELSQGKSYINQTLIAISRHTNKDIEDRYADNNDFFSFGIFQKGLNFLDMPIDSPQTDAHTRDDVDEELLALMSGRITESIEDRILSSIPSKVAASKVSSQMLDNSIFMSIPIGSVFASEENDDKTDFIFDRENVESVKRRIELMRTQRTDFDSLLEVNKKPTAAERGTATHEFLQFCDYENVDKNGVDAEIERLLALRFITERTAKIIDRTRILGFFNSELYREVSNAKRIHREFRFGMFRPASDFTENASLKSIVSDRKIFVQGSVDLIIERDNGDLLLCDYKTDRITAEQRANRDVLIADMTQKHGEQLKEYRNAISGIFGRAPVAMFIYSVTLGELIEINI